MGAWWRLLVVLSIVGNLGLGTHLYNRDRHLNLVTWGNAVDQVWQQINHAGMAAEPTSDGKVHTPRPQGIWAARESLDSLRSLPDYRYRVAEADMRTIQHFLRYVSAAYDLAAQEQEREGKISAESAERLATIRAATEQILRHQQQTNQLKSSRNPWNHSAWRAVWRSVAAGLRNTEFVPLPE